MCRVACQMVDWKRSSCHGDGRLHPTTMETKFIKTDVKAGSHMKHFVLFWFVCFKEKGFDFYLSDFFFKTRLGGEKNRAEESNEIMKWDSLEYSGTPFTCFYLFTV